MQLYKTYTIFKFSPIHTNNHSSRSQMIQQVQGQVRQRMFGSHRETELEQTLLDNFTRLKDTLSQSNYINIGNMHCLTVNLGILTSYVKDAFRSFIKVLQAYQEKNQLLRSILQKNGLQHLIPSDQAEEEIRNVELMELNQRIATHIAQKSEANHKDVSDLPKKARHHEKDRVSLSRIDPGARREQVKLQQKLVSRFMQTYMKNRLQKDPQVTTIIHKSSILNIFLKWAATQNNKIGNYNLSNVQMCLTNQIKKTFPGVLHNYRSFRGLRFAKEDKDLVKYTEIKETRPVQQDSSSIQSPPLPSFDDDYLAQ